MAPSPLAITSGALPPTDSGNTRANGAAATAPAAHDPSLMDYVDDASLVVGLGTLAAMIPLHGKGAAQAVETAGLMSRLGRLTRVTPALHSIIDSSPTLSAANAHAQGAWQGLRAARQSFGATKLGSAMMKAQGPLATVGIGLAGASLVRDVKAMADGNGDPVKIGLDLLGLAPAIGAGVRTAARARALASNSAAAETAAAGADELARTARGVTRVGEEAVEAASVSTADAVLAPLDEAVKVADTVVAKSEDVLAATPLLRVSNVPVPVARPSVVDRLGARAPRTASQLTDELAVAERKVATALDRTAADVGSGDATLVRDRLQQTLRVARDTREQVEVLAGQAVAAERTADQAQMASRVAAGTNSTVSMMVNSSKAVDTASRDHAGNAASGVSAVRIFLQTLLQSNARAGAARA